MDLFRKTFFLALSSGAFLFSTATCGDHCEGKNRTVVWQQHRHTVTEPFMPLDPNHARMLALGNEEIFTQEDAIAMDEMAVLKFRLAYGIDFDPNTNPSVQVFDGDIRVIPGVAQFIPYINNPPAEDIIITADTRHPERERKWIQVSVGRFVIFTANGTINNPSVPNNGAIYKPNSLWFHGFTLFLKKDSNWGEKKNREKVTLTSYQLGETFPNQWNFGELLVTMNCVDKKGNEGLVAFPTNVHKVPAGSTGINFAENFGVYSWEKICDDEDD